MGRAEHRQLYRLTGRTLGDLERTAVGWRWRLDQREVLLPAAGLLAHGTRLSASALKLDRDGHVGAGTIVRSAAESALYGLWVVVAPADAMLSLELDQADKRRKVVRGLFGVDDADRIKRIADDEDAARLRYPTGEICNTAIDQIARDRVAPGLKAQFDAKFDYKSFYDGLYRSHSNFDVHPYFAATSDSTISTTRNEKRIGTFNPRFRPMGAQVGISTGLLCQLAGYIASRRGEDREVWLRAEGRLVEAIKAAHLDEHD